MKAKKKKKKKTINIKRLRRFVVFSIVGLYFLSRLWSTFLSAGSQTHIAEYGKIESVIAAEGYVVRDEKVVKTIGQGEVAFFVSEGQKVARGQKLAEIFLEDLDEKSKKDLEIINLRIENIQSQQGSGIFSKDIEKLDREMHILLEKIKEDIKDREYGRISQYKEELNTLLDKKSVIAGEKSFSGKNLNQLEEQKQNLAQKINASIQVIKSDDPGMVAFGSDGLEEILNPKTISKITGEEFNTMKNALKTAKYEENQKGEIIRIVKDHRWSIIAEVGEEQAEGLEKGKNIKLRQRGQEREFSARIRDIIEADEKWIVIMDLSSFMEEFYNKRIINIDIIKDSYQGVMVPTSTIAEVDGRSGVFRVDVNGFARFVPVKIKTTNKEYAVVYDGSFEEVVGDTKERRVVNTIRLYDEILGKASTITDGQRVR